MCRDESHVTHFDQGRQAREGHAEHRNTAERCELPKPSHGNDNASQAHAASLARTHERNEYDFPVGLTPPTSDISTTVPKGTIVA